jgi:flagellar hook-basal body complex protein FliE
MTVQFNPNISGLHNTESLQPKPQAAERPDFGKAIQNSLEKVNDQQQHADQSMLDLLSGKQQDVNTVVADMAKADMSFKLLVGVRNKLVEAYKETMRMQI